MLSPCILIVDDEPEIRFMLRLVLEQAGYRTEQAENGWQAVKRCQQHPLPDLVMMDVSMPLMDGIEACRRIRQAVGLPVILLTVRDDEEVLLEGFSAGAHDFLAKPFRPRELRARVAALLQRSTTGQAAGSPQEDPADQEKPAAQEEPAVQEELASQEEPAAQTKVAAPGKPAAHQPPNGRLTYADLWLDPRTHEVRRAGQPVTITAIGFHLLMYFMRRPGEVITKESLLREIWSCASPKDNMVEAAIKRLRKELGDDSRQPRYIKTVWGVGYKFGENKD